MQCAGRKPEEPDRVLIDKISDGIVVTDRDGMVLFVNPAAEELFGRSRHELQGEALGLPLDRFIPERFRQAHRRHIRLFGAAGITSRSMHTPGELRGLRLDGHGFPMEATISQVAVGGEKLYTVILRDVTQRKQTEEALIQSEKIATLGRLLSSIAHEMNNPLEAVMNLLYLAQSSASLDPATRQYLEMAVAELSRAAQISRQTLGFSKGGSKRMRFQPTQMLSSLLALLERKLEKKAIVCEKEFFTDMEIWAVENEVRQVFWNLLTNSIDSTPAGGRIRLRVSRARSHQDYPGIRITVADNGHGISAPHRPHIFQPFFTTKETGNGLGLWVVSEVVKKHGGSIRVRSRTGPGKPTGTVFSVLLPAKP
jgi:PAS domain S-box-containing protein